MDVELAPAPSVAEPAAAAPTRLQSRIASSMKALFKNKREQKQERARANLKWYIIDPNNRLKM